MGTKGPFTLAIGLELDLDWEWTCIVFTDCVHVH